MPPPSTGGSDGTTAPTSTSLHPVASATASSDAASAELSVAECLQCYNAKMNAVEKAALEGAALHRRDFLEGECVYAAVQLVDAVDRRLDSDIRATLSQGPQGDAPGDVVRLTRLLLSAYDKTANTVNAAAITATLGTPQPEGGITATPAIPATSLLPGAADKINADRPRESVPLRDLPAALTSREAWGWLVVGRVLPAVLSAAACRGGGREEAAAQGVATACAEGVLRLLKRRGCLEHAVRFLLQRPRIFAEVVRCVQDTPTASALLESVVLRGMASGLRHAQQQQDGPFSPQERAAAACICEAVLVAEASCAPSAAGACGITQALCGLLSASQLTQWGGDADPDASGSPDPHRQDMPPASVAARRAVDIAVEGMAQASAVLLKLPSGDAIPGCLSPFFGGAAASRPSPPLQQPCGGAVVCSVRKAILYKFSDTRNLHHAPEALCHAAVYFMQHTTREVLQSQEAQLLAPTLQGVSARLASPIPSHRRLACVAARCLSAVLTPEEVVDFDDHPQCYERWLAERGDFHHRGTPAAAARPGGGNAALQNTPAVEQHRARRKAPKPAKQETGFEAAFSYDDAEDDDDGSDADEEEEQEEEEGSARDETGGGGRSSPTPSSSSSSGFWSSDDEEVPGPLPLNGAGEGGGGPSGVSSPVFLQDALKFLQGKMEDSERLERILGELPQRIALERAEEVSAAGPALFKAMHHLQNQYNIGEFDALREKSLVLLLSRIPEVTVRHLVDRLWGPDMSTIQRLEALKLLSSAADALRSERVAPEGGAATAAAPPGRGAGQGPASSADQVYCKGVAAIRVRRAYPPVDEEEVAGILAAKAEVATRVEAKTTRRGYYERARERGRGGAALFKNSFEKHAALFVYNLVGTSDRKHFNPVTHDDVMVLSELLRYLWHVGELLHGCLAGGDAEGVLRVILDFTFSVVDHKEPFVLAHALACAAACILSIPTPNQGTLPLLQRWVDVAQEVKLGRKGRDDPACASLASSLLMAIQRRMDEVLGPLAPGGEQQQQQQAPLIEVL